MEENSKSQSLTASEVWHTTDCSHHSLLPVIGVAIMPAMHKYELNLLH